MVYMSKRLKPHQNENVSPWPSIGPRTTGQAATGPKTSLYTGTAKELRLYTHNINKLKVKVKQDIQGPDILNLCVVRIFCIVLFGKFLYM